MLTHPKQRPHKPLKINLLNIIFILCAVLIFNSCTSNPPTVYDSYDPLIWKARVALKDGNNTKALAHFQEAFEVLPHDSQNDLFQAAEAALKIGKNDIAKLLLYSTILTARIMSVFLRRLKGKKYLTKYKQNAPKCAKNTTRICLIRKKYWMR